VAPASRPSIDPEPTVPARNRDPMKAFTVARYRGKAVITANS
jgi:hypothetical protein